MSFLNTGLFRSFSALTLSCAAAARELSAQSATLREIVGQLSALVGSPA